jgi:hypothetical protein
MMVKDWPVRVIVLLTGYVSLPNRFVDVVDPITATIDADVDSPVVKNRPTVIVRARTPTQSGLVPMIVVEADVVPL